MGISRKFRPTPEEVILLSERLNTYVDIMQELDDMKPSQREAIVNQLRHTYVNVAPVLKVLPEKFAGIRLKGYDEVFATTVSTAFSYSSKKTDDASFALGLRQYVERAGGIYLIMDFTLPDKRESMIDHVNNILAPESLAIYAVDATGSLDSKVSHLSLIFYEHGHSVFEQFWTSRTGRFFIAKYNDYFLN